MLTRLPAIDLIGVSELFSSCPSTRTSRCQACNSCSLKAWVRSLITTSSSGNPCSRMRVRRTPHRPAPPGNTACNRALRADRPGWPEAVAVRPFRPAAVPAPQPAAARRRGSPAAAAGVRRRRRSPRRFPASPCAAAWWLPAPPAAAPADVRPSVLISRITSPSASSGRGARPRTEKSPSRSAPSRFDSVCSGKHHALPHRERKPQPGCLKSERSGSTACGLRKSSVQRIHSAVAEPGSPASSASRTMRPS